MRRERGFVAIEFVVAVAMLLIPVMMLVAAIPQWVERRHVATVAAREAAAYASESFPVNAVGAADVATVVAANYGIPQSDIDVRVIDEDVRGGQVKARVTILMPALVIPFVGRVGRWHYTTDYSVRIDDYRSRT
jgi:Tfp pilus assembly protein PilE